MPPLLISPPRPPFAQESLCSAPSPRPPNRFVSPRPIHLRRGRLWLTNGDRVREANSTGAPPICHTFALQCSPRSELTLGLTGKLSAGGTIQTTDRLPRICAVLSRSRDCALLMGMGMANRPIRWGSPRAGTKRMRAFIHMSYADRHCTHAGPWLCAWPLQMDPSSSLSAPPPPS
jgi:hypothetical protein